MELENESQSQLNPVLIVDMYWSGEKSEDQCFCRSQDNERAPELDTN